jgi:S-adenosylmethionine:diacylglycerol 3-amino-3-carboxypropyl transferase
MVLTEELKEEIRQRARVLADARREAELVQVRFYEYYRNRVPTSNEAVMHFGAEDVSAVFFCLEYGDTGWMGDTFLVVFSEARH